MKKTLNVLLLDDDPDQFLLMRPLFAQLEEYEVHNISSIDLFYHEHREGCRWDIILLDYELGSKNAIELLQEKIPDPEETPVIILTEHSDKNIISNCLKLGAIDYITKEFLSIETLEHSLRYAQNYLRFKELIKGNQETLTLHQKAMDASIDGLGVIGKDDQFEYTNAALQQMFGTELNGLTWYSILLDPKISDQMAELVKSSLNQNGKWSTEIIQDNGRVLTVLLIQLSSGEYVCTVHDVSAQKKYERELFRLAYFDSLTNLPNTQMLHRKIKEKLDSKEAFTVFHLSLDRIKLVNSSLGPAVGDEVIKTISKRIAQHNTIPYEAFSLGGNELSLIADTQSDSEIWELVDQIHNEIKCPLNLHNREIIINASIGSAKSSLGYRTAENLLRAASTAHSTAKQEGGSSYAPFRFEMYQSAVARLELEEELRRALDQSEFVLFYQPIISTKPQRAVGAEALIRWIHPTKGFINPGDFIPITEDTGLIVPLGKWILNTATKVVKGWQDAGFPDFFASINVSVQQFQAGNLSEVVKKALDESKLPPHSLKLEITESIAMKNVDYTVHTFSELNEMGVQLSIDDFGTGYSSLAYLKKFPFHNLKIDQSFVQDLDQKNEDDLLVRTISELAQNLNLQVVAEGVETLEQFQILQKLGLPYYQGFLFGRPIPEKDFLPWLIAYNKKTKHKKIPPPNRGTV